MKYLLLFTLLATCFAQGQSFGKLLKKKKNNSFKIEQKKEVATDTTNSFKVSTATPIEPKQHSFEELEAQHKKGYDVEHELRRYLNSNPNDPKALYLYAQVSKSWDSYKAINRCIAMDSMNLNYRKLRAQKLMVSNAQKEELLLAIDDLNYVAKNGGEHYKVYGGIATCYKELANETMRFVRPKIKKDPFGDNTAYNQEYIAIYQQRIDYYNQALAAIDTGSSLGAEKSKVVRAKADIKSKIAELEQMIAEQPNKN